MGTRYHPRDVRVTWPSCLLLNSEPPSSCWVRGATPAPHLGIAIFQAEAEAACSLAATPAISARRHC